MLKEMEPKPVKAEEDAGSIAAFMETMNTQSEQKDSASGESHEKKEKVESE